MLVIAHRGASAAAPENTPEAFELADRLGADGVELDVRLVESFGTAARSAPGAAARLVAVHDRLPDDPEVIEGLPELDAVLDASGDRMLINVEIKNEGASAGAASSMRVVDATVEALRARGDRRRDRWLISSFSAVTIDRVRRIAPEFRTALLVEGIGDRAIDSAVRAGHVAIHPDVESLSPDVVERAHDVGLFVMPWTCNDGDRIVELASMGVDAVCTDVPDVALSSLGRTASPPPPAPRWPSR